ncbi:Lambda-crystallin-like protein [Frankliniella fusca]|uniref:Lambda-crystallin-like protein n=1 Tax=Frankliniella fusca TaxID=407009 RepID=A0AAE1LQH2_9NEOP|nr:Lambda-crystallin-like protein [Frankliniella fusca]
MAENIGILGSGLIGRSWAMLFAGAGYKVRLFDIEPKQVQSALKDIEVQLNELERSKLIRGSRSAKEQISLISGTSSLQECVSGALLVQECTPEFLDIKLKALKELDAVVQEPTIISSSTSTHLPSVLSKDLKNKERFIVSHPVNPPYYVKLVEIVPAPYTASWVPPKVRAIMEQLGQVPVSLKKEVPGFSLNRIQYVILNEAWRQVEDGVLDVADVDKVMSEGLGPRYAFLGALEVAHLNAEGMANYCERYAPTIHSVSETIGPIPHLLNETHKTIHKQLCEVTPLDKLQERRQWRDACLTKLSVLKQEMEAMPNKGVSSKNQ